MSARGIFRLPDILGSGLVNTFAINSLTSSSGSGAGGGEEARTTETGGVHGPLGRLLGNGRSSSCLFRFPRSRLLFQSKLFTTACVCLQLTPVAFCRAAMSRRDAAWFGVDLQCARFSSRH